MIPPKTYYPWYSLPTPDPMEPYSRTDPLVVFLKGICLQHRYGVLQRKLRITDPSQFSRYRARDLLQVGMTELEVNRLVSHLLDLDMPTGNLLTDSATNAGNAFSSGALWHSNWDLRRPVENPYSVSSHLSNGPKLLRKLFGKKPIPPSSAPVSPSHHHYEPLRTPSPTHGHHRRWAHGIPPSRRSSPPVGLRTTPTPSPTPTPRRASATTTATKVTATSTSPPPLTCLIPEQDIQLHSRLGVGSFGIVRRADWTTPSGEVIPVAVKLLRPEAIIGDHFKAFLDELRAMQSLSHPNLIRLHGVVLSNPIMMVTELAPLGSLLLHLRAQSVCASSKTCSSSSSELSHLPQVHPALQVDALWDMGVQIAQGMSYLCSRGLVHRDLAARNILLAAVRAGEYPQIKIGDFGLVRTVTTSVATSVHQTDPSFSDAVYAGHIEQRIPFAWSAPESIRKRIFSQASDVWSWGVTCWEMWTSGAAPWPGMDAQRLLVALDAGRRLAWPRTCCPRRLYQIMLACWRTEPQRRPTFAYLIERLNKIRPFEVVATQTFDEADRLGLEFGDVVVVVEGQPHNFWWRGQNRRTGEVGSFPRSIVRRDGKLSPEDISRPIANTFVHAAHLDTNGQRWGVLEKRTSQYGRLSPASLDDSLSTDHKMSIADPTHTGLGMFDDLDRHDPGGSDETWYPIQDSTSTHSFVDTRTTYHGNEDAYSCFTGDAPAPPCGKPSLEQYDDDEDERAILDRAPNSMTGTAEHTLRDVNIGKRDVLCDWTYDSSPEYLCSTILPPPPGPEEDDEESADVRRKHAFSLSSLFSPIKPPEQPESSSETQDDTQMPGNDTTSRSKVASAPPLIDFYSQTILPRPQSNLRFPIPSAPVYDPRYSHLFPMHRSSWFGAPTSPQMFRPPRAPSVIPHSGPDDDPFDLFKSCPPKPGPNPFIHHQSVETLPDPPADPFDWDTLRRSVTSKHTTVKNELGSRSSTPVAMTQSTPPDVGRSRHVVLERQLLVGSAIPSNPFSTVSLDPKTDSGVTTTHKSSPDVVRPRPVLHKNHETPILNTPVSVQTKDGDTTTRSSNPDQRSFSQNRITMEISCIQAQVPGCSVNEAREALAYLTNPFFSINPYLHVPPIPSAPFYQPAVGSPTYEFLTQQTVGRIQLAVRLLSANRLYQLGLVDWDTCCRILSAFHWSMTTAADWLIEHHQISCDKRTNSL
ncbi:activated CDC42 kinase 1 [Clonorchis sinensis]|uniref:non-specific protein-tyrosine kinase n=1 Tax=Clonorchis sinensis TaxID=79923 RepID=G7YVQ7_CLOSI|nr:activated CDC42 kinase 1 [Clonorchis sinensis]